jgi:hypothetical protein
MPFKSKAQMRLFHAKAARGEMPKETVKEWQDATPDAKNLPEKLEKKGFIKSFEKNKKDNVFLEELKGIKKSRLAVRPDDGLKPFELEGQKVDSEALAGKTN